MLGGLTSAELSRIHFISPQKSPGILFAHMFILDADIRTTSFFNPIGPCSSTSGPLLEKHCHRQ